ncbi:MAG TPA: GEVED domain-containing protein, partial [Chitinophagales bacterium]|nr:GEVED domain-containing protein [Chitinophagales bacterium]
MNKFTPSLRRLIIAGGIMLSSATAFSQYCIPAYTTGTAEGDFIDGVTVSDLSNIGSGGAITDVGYSDYTGLTANLTIGTTYTMTLNNNPSFSQTYTAWIDGNHDDVFSTDEVLGSVSLVAGATGSFDFSLAPGTMEGATRMRVRCIYPAFLATPLDPCASTSYGEAEDYTVVIEGAAAIDGGVVDVTAPTSGVTLGVESVTVTIQNYGSESLSGFNVSYNVDGGAAVTELYAGTIAAYSTASYTFSTTHDFTADGCYEIGAWTSVDGDAAEINDDYTETVCNLGPITGTGAVYMYSNTTGGEPWFTTTNTTAMNTVFGAEGIGWTREYFETADVYAVFNPDNCFVFLEGSDSHAAELESFLATYGADIENWVASGGKLLLNAAPNEGDGMSFGFDGTTLTYPYFTDNATAVDAAHPIFNGPFAPAGTDYTGGSFGHAIVSGTGYTNVMVDLFSPSSAVLAEKPWGDGRVMVGGMTTNNFHSPLENAANLRANILAYLSCVEILFCETPGGLFVDGITTNDAVCHWNAIDGADQYRFALPNTFTGVIAKR